MSLDDEARANSVAMARQKKGTNAGVRTPIEYPWRGLLCRLPPPALRFVRSLPPVPFGSSARMRSYLGLLAFQRLLLDWPMAHLIGP